MKTKPAMLIVFAAALLASACSTRKLSGDSDGGSAPKAVRLAAVELSRAPEPARYSAILTPNAQVDLAFRVSRMEFQASAPRALLELDSLISQKLSTYPRNIT